MLNRARESENQARENMRIEPLGTVAVEGIVRERSQPNLAKRHGLERNSIGFGLLTQAIGDADPLQLTVQVDELTDDPDAIDYLSYTFFVPKSRADQDIARGDVMRALLTPVEMLGSIKLWLAKEIERLY